MAEFLTFKKHSHVIYHFYCKFDADYENLKIFHFWANRAGFWAFFWIFSEFFRIFSNFFFELSDSESKKAKKKIPIQNGHLVDTKVKNDF